MKKILLYGGLVLLVIGLHAHGACLLKNIELESSCTGGAAKIKDESLSESDVEADRKSLEKMYNIPTMSLPTPYKNGFPMLNPSTNCMYGICQPR